MQYAFLDADGIREINMGGPVASRAKVTVVDLTFSGKSFGEIGAGAIQETQVRPLPLLESLSRPAPRPSAVSNPQ